MTRDAERSVVSINVNGTLHPVTAEHGWRALEVARGAER